MLLKTKHIIKKIDIARKVRNGKMKKGELFKAKETSL